MDILTLVLHLVGSLGLLMYGMKLMSDGIQKSAGDSLHRILSFMTGNRFLAVLTGFSITAIVQSSGATTVMVVSFANAGLLTLKQSIGVIFGANIGTTVSAWIVSLIGFNFNLSAFAIPAFGIGFFLSFFKRIKKEGLGEAIMGLALLFMGLELLSKALPTASSDQLNFLNYFADRGTLGLFIGAFMGFLITVLFHSSSAATAVILTMSYNGLLSWPFAASMVLGSNIGSTIDAVLAAIGTKVNARRAACVHVLFNVAGFLLAMIFFNQFLHLTELIVPSTGGLTNITTRLATLHTLFNIIATVIFLPFVTPLAKFVEFIIKPNAYEPPLAYTLDMPTAGIKESAESHIFRAEREILDMSDVVLKMFGIFSNIIEDRENEDLHKLLTQLANFEEYADQMQEELSAFLVKISRMPLSGKSENNVRQMLRIVDDLESMTDDIYSASILIERSVKKKLDFEEEDLERLNPYIDLVDRFITFVHENLNKRLSTEQHRYAQELEDQIDAFRKNLKKVARKRLEQGANVRSELLYIDLVRSIERMGDHAFSISDALAHTK